MKQVDDGKRIDRSALERNPAECRAGESALARRTILGPSLIAFFISGFAALLYQVVWQRMLAIYSGADVHSATIVVAAFMAGLGCGSLGGGYIADRIPRTKSLGLFAAAELAVAAFGVISSTLFYGVLYERIGRWGLGLAPTALVLFTSLLWPTFFMGMSLPLLARGITRQLQAAASEIGLLYGVNALGAAAGAFCTTWWFLPDLGLSGSLRIAVVLNLICVAIVVPVVIAGRRESRSDDRRGIKRSETIQTVTNTAASRGGSAAVFYGALFAVSGFIALSYELVWFRLIGVMLKSTAFGFGTLLGFYLLGLGLGSASGSAIARRIRDPAAWFLLLQALAGLYAAVSLTTFVARLDRTAALQPFASYFASYEALDVRIAVIALRQTMSSLAIGIDPAAGLPWAFIRLYVVLPAMLIGPPTFLAGFSFPLLQRVVQTDLARIGRHLGFVLAANILGSTCGAFVSGWLLLDWLGVAGTAKVLFVLSAGFGLLSIRHVTKSVRFAFRGAAYTTALLAIAGIVLTMPTGARLWSRLHGALPNRMLAEEDGSGLSVLKAERTDFGLVAMFVNGIGHSWIPYGGIHTVLGALPALIHAAPRSALLIGLGSGDSLFAMSARHEMQHIVSVEIVGPEHTMLRRFASLQGYSGLRAVLDDPRIEYRVGDGRLYLRAGDRKFDIIEADALYPTSAYAGNLYSIEYFQLLLEHLNPGGLAVSWVPTERSARTLLAVFPYVWRQGPIMIGSNAKISVDRERIERYLRESTVADYFTLAGVDIRDLLEPYLGGAATTYDPSFDRSILKDVNTDLHPRDEFDLSPTLH